MVTEIAGNQPTKQSFSWSGSPRDYSLWWIKWNSPGTMNLLLEMDVASKVTLQTQSSWLNSAMATQTGPKFWMSNTT